MVLSHAPVAEDHTSQCAKGGPVPPQPLAEAPARAVIPDAVARSSPLAETLSALTESKCPDLTIGSEWSEDFQDIQCLEYCSYE